MADELTYKELSPESDNLDAFSEMFEEAFPEEERMGTFEELIQISKADPTAHVIGIYDGDNIAGMQVYQKFDKFIYFLFFAVNSKIRGKGYGSKLIQHLIKSNPNHAIIGCAETPFKDSENFEQRIARKRFYERNGLHYSNFSYTVPGLQFTVFSSCQEEEIPEYVLHIIGNIIDALRQGKQTYLQSIVRFY